MLTSESCVMTKKLIYWDSDIWIHFLVGSKEHESLKVIYEMAKKGEIGFVISTFVIAEVYKNEKSSDFFGRSYIHVFPVNLNIALKTQEIQRIALQRKGAGRRTAKGTSIKPADAIHIATACYGNAEELHTLDKKILNCSDIYQKKDGSKLKICKPDKGNIGGLLVDLNDENN